MITVTLCLLIKLDTSHGTQIDVHIGIISLKSLNSAYGTLSTAKLLRDVHMP